MTDLPRTFSELIEAVRAHFAEQPDIEWHVEVRVHRSGETYWEIWDEKSVHRSYSPQGAFASLRAGRVLADAVDVEAAP